MILVDAQLVSPFLFIVGSLLSLVIVVFSVGAYGLEHHVFGASDSDSDSDSFPCVSLYFNLYVVIVASYITIRVYTLFVDPMFQSLSSKLYYGGGATGTPSSVRSVTDAQTKNTNTNTNTSDDGTITTAKEQQRKGNSTNITTRHHQQEQEQVQNQQDGNNDDTTMVVNMTGNYQLVSHENFEEFLGTQGVPKMFQGLACKSRPIHRIVHTKRNHRTPTTTTTIETNPQQYDTVSIKAEGIVDTYVEYNLDGPAIVTKIKGKPYEDTMTYLTYEEMGISPPGLPPTTTTSPTDTNGVEATRNSADTGDEDDDYSSTDSISADASASASASASSEDGGSEEEEAETVVSSATLNMSGEFIDQESSTSFDILKQKMLAQFTEGGNLRTSKVKRLIRRSSKKAKKGKKNQNCTAAPSTLPPSKKKETPGLTTTTTTAAENDEHTVVNSDVTEDDGTTMTTKNTNNNNNNTQIYCGVKNIKRQHEEKYTLIVQRYVHTNQTKIDMILHVKYDDPNKKNVIAKQYYERI